MSAKDKTANAMGRAIWHEFVDVVILHENMRLKGVSKADLAQHPAQDPIQANPPTVAADCFPGLGFEMPDNVPNTTEGWWCDYADEYAFVGFSYEVTACECSARFPQDCAHPSPGQSLARLTREFKDIRTRFNGRYVRLYGAWCVGDPHLNEAR